MNRLSRFVFVLLCLLFFTLLSCPGEIEPLGPTEPNQSPAKQILFFNFPYAANLFLGKTVYPVISETNKTISCVLLPSFSGNVSAMTPHLVLSKGATCTPATDVTQDFSSPVTYTVRAEDGTTQNYTVSVKVATIEESKDSSLSDLEITMGNSIEDQIVDFSPAKTTYSFAVKSTSATFYITAAASYGEAGLKFGKAGQTAQKIVSGQKNGSFSLEAGLNTYELTVTSMDESTTAVYTINIDRGAPLPLEINAGWLAGELATAENVRNGGAVWYYFPAEIGKHYKIAIDDDSNDSNAGWTKFNGGWTDINGAAPWGDVLAQVYLADGVTQYDSMDPMMTYTLNYQEFGSYYYVDDETRYIRICAQENIVRIKLQCSSNGTYAIQVRESDPQPVIRHLNYNAWYQDSFSDEFWNCQDTSIFEFDAIPGQSYRIGVDTAFQTNDQGHGWSPGFFGSQIVPTAANLSMRAVRPNGVPYAYEDGESNWVRADWYNSYYDEGRKFITITALDSIVRVNVREGLYPTTSAGSFAIQVRPVNISETNISTGTDWLLSSFTDEENAWLQQRVFIIATESGRTYEVGLDTRETTQSFCWNPSNGGSPDVHDACLVQRIFQSNGILANHIEEINDSVIVPAEGWESVETYNGYDTSFGSQSRYLTVTSTGSHLRLEVKSASELMPSGVFGVQVRAIPQPVHLGVNDNVWHEDSIGGNMEKWNIEYFKYYTFNTTPGVTYYVMVDDRGTAWTSLSGGAASAMTAEISVVNTANGPYYPGCSSFGTKMLDSYDSDPNSKCIVITATESISRFTLWLNGTDYAGSYAIKISTSDPR